MKNESLAWMFPRTGQIECGVIVVRRANIAAVIVIYIPTQARGGTETNREVYNNQPEVGGASNRENREPMMEEVADAETLELVLAAPATNEVGSVDVGRCRSL